MDAVIARGNGQISTVGNGECAAAVQSVIYAVQSDGAAVDGHVAVGLQTLGAGGCFLGGILLGVEPAWEAEVFHVLRGIGCAAAGGDGDVAGPYCEVGGGLNAVTPGCDG